MSCVLLRHPAADDFAMVCLRLQVMFVKAKQMWETPCRIAAIVRKPCCEVSDRLKADPDRAVHAQPLSKTALLKTHQQLQSARRNNYYKCVHCRTVTGLDAAHILSLCRVRRQHKLLAQDEDGNSRKKVLE